MADNWRMDSLSPFKIPTPKHPAGPKKFGAANDFLLGRDPARRSGLRASFQSVCLLLMALPILWVGMLLDLMSYEAWQVVSILDSVGPVIYFVLVRLGVDVRLGIRQPGVLLASYVLVLHGISYALIPSMRAPVFMLSPMTILFGAFFTVPRLCNFLGWFAVVVYSIAILIVARGEPGKLLIHEQFFNFLYVIIMLPSAGKISGILGSIRKKYKVQNAELVAANARVGLLASTDELTGLPNRRYILDLIEKEISRSKRHASSLYLCLIDLDHFKRINDTYGHGAGDMVLRTFGASAQASLRQTDCVARWGGEEFILLLPHSDLNGAVSVVERVRSDFAASELWQSSPHLKATFSAGLGAWTPGETAEQCLSRVDLSLYDAKACGRNRMSICDGDRKLRGVHP